MRSGLLIAFGAPAAALALFVGMPRSHGVPIGDEAARARCASRVALSLTGRSPSADLLATTDPQSQVDALLDSPEFVEQFSRFVNSQMNPEPGMTPADDTSYFLAKYVLQNHRPWHELFDGQYRVDAVPAQNGMPATAQVVADPDGLGYFRSEPWMVRYAGNEEEGYRLSAAFRIQQNVIGLDVTAVTNQPGVDVSASGRMAPGCRGCHYDPYFALDKVAKILSKRSGTGAAMTFTPPTEGPQQILDGRMIANDAELVSALVSSTDHQFRTCRMAFEYLYGRGEDNCEAALFDRCIDAYASSGDVRAAIRAIATDPGFCE